MGHYYKYSRRRLQGPPAVDCMYAAELNKEWLRVMVDEVQENVSGFQRFSRLPWKRVMIQEVHDDVSVINF